MDKITNKVGPVVEGKDFFGRTKEIERAIELLEDGNNLILAAPRRVGKTSFARKLIDVMTEKGWKGIEVDLQRAPSELSFMKLFLKEVKGEHWLEKFAPESLKIIFKDIVLEFNKQKQDLYRKIDDVLPHNKNTLIIIDEFTIFLEDALRKKNKENEFEDIIAFLNWIKGLRQKKGSKIRWVFCSSISISSYLHKHNSTKRINDLTSFRLGELRNDEPQLLIKALADSKNIVFQDEHIEYVLEKIGWKLPFFIQILFGKIFVLLDDDQTISKKTIDEAYSILLDEETSLDTWIERLFYYDDKRFAKLILNELSKSKTGKKKNFLEDIIYAELNDKEKTDEILHPLLKQLEADGYIMNDKNKYTFRSPLLRDFWNNKFGD